MMDTMGPEELADGKNVVNLWNVLMYFVPFIFFALSAGCFVVGLTSAVMIEGLYRELMLFAPSVKKNVGARMLIKERTMRVRKPLSVLCSLFLGLSFAAAADVNGDMNNFFNKLGFASNTSQPQVWQGQARVTPPAVRCMPERR
ncbi:hypothetical protein [Klebsiella variicola]|uniref:hypothetical protein n=1 Tax=Klebsiella variicola TaxID=244366 RepID=UPI000A40ADEE